MYFFHSLGFSIQDFTRKDLSLITTASGVEVPWPTRPRLSSWTPQRDRALSTTRRAPTDSSLTAALCATALHWTIPGWWRRGISTRRPAREAGVRQAGTSWARRRPGGSPGGALAQPCPWPSLPQKAEKPMKTACLTSLPSTGSTVRAAEMSPELAALGSWAGFWDSRFDAAGTDPVVFSFELINQEMASVGFYKGQPLYLGVLILLMLSRCIYFWHVSKNDSQCKHHKNCRN